MSRTQTRREQVLTRISIDCSQRLVRLAVLEVEAMKRSGDAWQQLVAEHQPEHARLVVRDQRAQRLLVRADYSPSQRRMRDEEERDDRADQHIFGLRRGERETEPWWLEVSR
jgi:nicotinamide mononucleotide adenylyltransferase